MKEQVMGMGSPKTSEDKMKEYEKQRKERANSINKYFEPIGRIEDAEDIMKGDAYRENLYRKADKNPIEYYQNLKLTEKSTEKHHENGLNGGRDWETTEYECGCKNVYIYNNEYNQVQTDKTHYGCIDHEIQAILNGENETPIDEEESIELAGFISKLDKDPNNKEGLWAQNETHDEYTKELKSLRKKLMNREIKISEYFDFRRNIFEERKNKIAEYIKNFKDSE